MDEEEMLKMAPEIIDAIGGLWGKGKKPPITKFVDSLFINPKWIASTKKNAQPYIDKGYTFSMVRDQAINVSKATVDAGLKSGWFSTDGKELAEDSVLKELEKIYNSTSSSETRVLDEQPQTTTSGTQTSKPSTESAKEFFANAKTSVTTASMGKIGGWVLVGLTLATLLYNKLKTGKWKLY